MPDEKIESEFKGKVKTVKRYNCEKKTQAERKKIFDRRKKIEGK